MNSQRCVRWGVIVVFAWASIALGCSAQHSSKGTQPTKKEVQADSDRFFDRLQKEQQDR